MEVQIMKPLEKLKKPEILIIDDSPADIQFVAAILKHEKYTVRAITDGRKTFEALEKGLPDLILLDIVLPDLDGYEICRRVKQNEKYNSIPIIFFTAIDDAESVVKGFRVGGQDYVSKPVNPDVLLARVKTQIQLKFNTDRIESSYKEMESFNYIISHDLKAPLRDILELVKYLMQAFLSNDREDEKELLEAINEKSGEAVMLIDKLSQLTRATNIPLKVEAIDMEKLTMDVYKELTSENKDRKIEFNCDQLPIVFGDRLLLRQVMVNILSNSIKYTRDRKPAVIDVKCFKSGMEYVFSVRDNGIGFDMKYSGKLFGMFQRLHSQQEFEGTGAGLAIIKKIVDRHNGKAWIEAQPDKGAAFFFSLPIRIN